MISSGPSPSFPVLSKTQGHKTHFVVPKEEGKLCLDVDARRVKELKEAAISLYHRTSGGSQTGIYNALSVGLTVHGGNVRLRAPAAPAQVEQQAPPDAEHAPGVAEDEVVDPMEPSEESMADAEEAASG